MLYKETVSEETMEMIQVLMKEERLRDFYLVGGTSLSLRLGHRMSVDIDLFSEKKFNQFELMKTLHDKLNADFSMPKSHGFSLTIGRENIDLWHYPARNAREPEIIEGIRMLSIEDVAAMKINGIAHDFFRPKDHIDLHYVLEEVALSELEKVYAEKYPDLPAKEHIRKIDSVGMVKGSKLAVFDKKLEWDKVEKRIRQAILFPDKVFKNAQGLRKGKSF